MRAVLPMLLALACSPDPTVDSEGDSAAELSHPALSVSVHPELSTLVTVGWTMDRPAERCWLRYGVTDEDPRSTPSSSCAAGAHSQVLLGLPADVEIELHLVIQLEGETHDGPAHSTRTDAPPATLVVPQLESWDPALSDGSPWLLGAVEGYGGGYYDGPYQQFILDRQGRVVWYRQLEDGLSSTFPRVSRDGTHIISERVDRFGLAGGQPGVIQRMGVDLTVLSELEVPGLRFAWDEADDGSIYYFDREAEGEGWLSRISTDGTRERLFDCVSWIADRCTDTWCCECNAVVLVPERGSVLMSLWATDTVLEVDIDSHSVRHSWGQLDGSWATEPESAGFELQHYPVLTSAGTLLVATQVPDAMLQHRIREYSLDEHDQVLRELWSWGEGEDLFAQYQGEALRLDNGNTLMNFGSAGAIREITGDGQLAWSVDWSDGAMLGHTTLVGELYALAPGSHDSGSRAKPTSTGSGSRDTPKR